VSDPRARPRTPVPRRPAERYGRPPNPARVRTTYAVGAIVALVAVGALLALALHKSRPAVAAGVTGFTVVSDSAVTHDLATRSRAVSGELVGCHITRDH